MSSRLRQALSVGLVASGILVAAGCTSDTVTGGSQAVRFSVVPDPTGIGRYTAATWIIRKIQVLPADPATAALYGSNAIILFFQPTGIDLATTQEEFISNISLSPGTYRVSSIEVTPLVLIDEDLSPTPATCIEGLAVIDGSQPCHDVTFPTPHCEPDLPSSLIFSDPSNLGFAVQPGQSTLLLKVNIPALIAGYESAFTCTPGCGPGGSPCLTAVNESVYRTAVLANISFQ